MSFLAQNLLEIGVFLKQCLKKLNFDLILLCPSSFGRQFMNDPYLNFCLPRLLRSLLHLYGDKAISIKNVTGPRKASIVIRFESSESSINKPQHKFFFPSISSNFSSCQTHITIEKLLFFLILKHFH